jgi:hypothetical protein
MLIKKLHNVDYFNDIVKECQELLFKVPLKGNINQLSLQSKDPNIEDWYGSTGTVYKNGSQEIFEEEYCYINPSLKGSAIEKWIHSLGNVFRTRLMIVPPRTCYSLHNDSTARIHLPIITSPDNFMCFPSENVMQHFPANGDSFWVDTTKYHTFMNCSLAKRIHLVAAVTL